MVLEQLDIHMEKIILDSLTPFIRINSIWITDLKCKTIKLLEDKIGESLDNLEHSDDVLGIIPKARSMKEITDKLNLH